MKTSAATGATAKPAKGVKPAATKPLAKPVGAVPKPVSKAAAKRTKAIVEAAVSAVAAVAKQKHKLVRDSFTIPKSEFSVLEGLKLRAAVLRRPTKKSEILRAGISVLNAMSDKQFLAAVAAVPSLKTGRPKTQAPEAPPLK